MTSMRGRLPEIGGGGTCPQAPWLASSLEVRCRFFRGHRSSKEPKRCALRNIIQSARGLTVVPLAASLLLVAGGSAAAEDDQPTVAKDSVQVTAYTINEFKKDY